MHNNVVFIYKFQAKTGEISCNIGEGCSDTVYNEGYINIISRKRAYDRAVLGLIEHQYDCQIFTDQDAEIMNDMVPSENPMEKKEQVDPVKVKRTVAALILENKQDEARKILGEVKGKINTRYYNGINALIENSEKVKREIDEEKVEEKTTKIKGFIPMNEDEERGATVEQKKTAIKIANEIVKCEDKASINTVATKHVDDVKALPPNVKKYLTRVKVHTQEQFGE